MPTPIKDSKLGWIGTGRMGYSMAERLAKGGCDIAVWNRTKAKAEPLTKHGAKVVNQLEELSTRDILFVMVSTYEDVKEVIGKTLAAGGNAGKPKMVVECSSISLEGSAELRKNLAGKGVEYLAAPVSGNAKVIKAGKLTFVVSGPKAAYEKAKPYLDMMGTGSSYVGEGELARIAKICHNVMLGVVIQNLCEITILAQKAGMPRHAEAVGAGDQRAAFEPGERGDEAPFQGPSRREPAAPGIALEHEDALHGADDEPRRGSFLPLDRSAAGRQEDHGLRRRARLPPKRSPA